MAKTQIAELFRKSRFDEVLKKINFLNKFTSAKEEPEKKIQVLMFKAEALIRNNKLPAALKALNDVLKLDPKNIAANYQKALCLFILQRNKESLGYITAAIEENKKAGNAENFNFIILKAGILYGLGSAEHRKWLEQAKKLDKERAEKFMNQHFKEFRELVDAIKKKKE